MKMELIEGSETSAISIVTPGNYPKENILHTGHGESLKIKKTDIKLVSLYSTIKMMHGPINISVTVCVPNIQVFQV